MADLSIIDLSANRVSHQTWRIEALPCATHPRAPLSPIRGEGKGEGRSHLMARTARRNLTVALVDLRPIPVNRVSPPKFPHPGNSSCRSFVAPNVRIRHVGQMTAQTRALCVHLLTATGAVFAMLAMLAAVEEKWSLMFLWLVVAFAVDGADGPLARRFDVKNNAPQFNGELLDLIIDYLTYVFVPAYALFKSGILPGWTGWIAIIVITFASAMYFADNRMKTKDNSFSGFPGCWNMVVLVLFAVAPNFWITLSVVVVLAVTMFVPVKFIHPVRTERWRVISLPMTAAWTIFAGWAAWVEFDTQSWAHWGLIVTSIYLVFAGVAQQIMPERDA